MGRPERGWEKAGPHGGGVAGGVRGSSLGGVVRGRIYPPRGGEGWGLEGPVWVAVGRG